MHTNEALSTTGAAHSLEKVPSGFRPWEDRALSLEERFDAYKAHVREQVLALDRAAEKLGTLEELRQLKESPETQKLFAHAEQLSEMTAEECCWRIDGGLQRELLGKNFLGAEEWRAQGIDVGEPPPLPHSITRELLESYSPLHPGELIKDTHLLVLVPKTVNGEPYTALELHKLCSTRTGSGDALIYDGANTFIRDAAVRAQSWKGQDWAKTPQATSEWVFLPKSEPDLKKMRETYGKEEGDKRHFRSKDVAAQQDVHVRHYKEYREVKTVELMTAAMLYDLTHKERLLPNGWVRCAEPNASGGRVCVGYFRAPGLGIRDDLGGRAEDSFGRALARKS